MIAKMRWLDSMLIARDKRMSYQKQIGSLTTLNSMYDGICKK